jgi:hypothetical protein
VSAPAIDRPSAGAEYAAREALEEIVSEQGRVDLGHAVASLPGVPAHIASRALSELLAEGVLELTDEQELKLKDRAV